MSDADKIIEGLNSELESLRQEVATLNEEAVLHRRTEEELRRTTQEREAIFYALPDLKFRLDAKGTILDCQGGQVVALNVPSQELLGKRMQDVLPADVGRQFGDAIRKMFESSSQVRIAYSLFEDGTKHFEARLLPLLESEVLVVVHDITERRHQEILRTAHQQVREAVLRMRSAEDIGLVLKTILENLKKLEIPFQDCGINVVDAEAEPPEMHFYTLLQGGVEQEIKAERMSMEQHVLTQIWRAGEVAYQRDLEKEDRYQERSNFVDRAVRAVVDIPFPHGTLAFNSSVPDPFSEQHIALMRELADMLSEGFQRMEDLRQIAAERERLVVTLRSIGDGVIATDRSGRIIMINQVSEVLTGWSQAEALGRPLAEVFNIVNERTREPCENPVEKVLESGLVVGLANHTVLIARDGRECSIADSGAPIRTEGGQIIGVVLVFRDVTVERKVEAERLRTQKLESVGLLAGGIAHDFNNLLVGILGTISLARVDVELPDKLDEILADVERSARQARGLTQQLLTFAKGGAPIKETASLEELLRGSADFVLRGLATGCKYDLADDLWSVEVDKGQISQVIHNLVLNAHQAMAAGGTIHISAKNTIPDADLFPLQEGRYVEIAVADQGVGIPPEHLQRIFDPYFTTKQEGSGLGLATSYSVIVNHGGYLTAYSELGKGSTFRIYLPARGGIAVAAEEAPAAPLQGSGRVLVMDDEEVIRSVAKRMLELLGYQVELAGDGDEALELYRRAMRSGESFRAVLMDLTITEGLGGRETIKKKLLAMDPAARVAVLSGYSNDPIMAEYRSYRFSGVISKPYDIQTLSQVMDQIITQKAQ